MLAIQEAEAEKVGTWKLELDGALGVGLLITLC